MTREPENMESRTDALSAFFEAGEVAPVDPGFRIAVMEAVARRRFRLGLAIRTGVLALLVILAGLLIPVVDQLATALGAPLLEILVLVLLAVLGAFAAQAWLQRHPDLPRLKLGRLRLR
ncbi:hypothetical protein [Maricaulis parjimensis]|uniref:hypothetical protein n=1 Tax=Maricaulis parjimensis TaxID=144023 RepID=UPI001939D5EB|nr:hypothetical protein [Maricaulis parjimensis]